MSFKANLYVEDQKYKILNCEYELTQAVDHKNKPNSRAKGGLLSVMVETSKKDATKNHFLFNWMASDSQVKNGLHDRFSNTKVVKDRTKNN